MKKIISIILAMCMVLSVLCLNVFGDSQEVSVYVDNEKLTFDVSPVVEDGRTLVPIRAISEFLKYEVNWNGDKWEAEIKNNGSTMVIGVGKTAYTKNGEIREMDVPAKLVNGRTLVPLRLIAENFGCNVNWDGNTNSVYITTKNDASISEIDYKKWFPNGIINFEDYSNGSIINPLTSDFKFGILYTERKSYEYLSWQPKDEKTMKGITLKIAQTQGGMEKIFGEIVEKNTDSDKSWKIYPIEIEYIAGSGELNLNKLLSSNNIYNEFGERYNIYDYCLIDCKLSPQEVVVGGAVLTEDQPRILEVKNRGAGGVTSDYVETIAICILSDKNSDSPLLRVYTDYGLGSVWMHIDSSKTSDKLEYKRNNDVGKTVYDAKDTDDEVMYAVKMRIKQLEIKIEAMEKKSQEVLKNKYYTMVNGEWILWYNEDLVNEINSDFLLCITIFQDFFVLQLQSGIQLWMQK